MNGRTFGVKSGALAGKSGGKSQDRAAIPATTTPALAATPGSADRIRPRAGRER